MLYSPFPVYGDQTGTCTAGTEFCEENTLNTTNSTTTSNTNVNTNTNTNTNANTNSNTNVSTATNTNNNTNNNTNSNTSSNTNVNTSTSNNANTSVNTNSNTNDSTSSVTSNATSNNTNVNDSTSSNTNVNKNTSDSNVKSEATSKNENNNTSDNTNRNINQSQSEQVITQNINQKAPPASAIAPSIMSYSQDLCTTGVSGAFQGQVFGLSGGKAIRDENCERLKLSKYLYDTGMKVASVGLLCQDPRVFKAMYMAGTPCPYEGKIGKEAELAWQQNPEDRPDYEEAKDRYVKQCRERQHANGLKKSRLKCVYEFKNQG
tara:strand:- start:549 stop:1505 length:957 start_codon:yes stop_codon:yes gene_type:complete